MVRAIAQAAAHAFGMVGLAALAALVATMGSSKALGAEPVQIVEVASCFNEEFARLPVPDWANTENIYDGFGLVEIVPGFESGQYFLRVMSDNHHCRYLIQLNDQVEMPRSIWFFGDTVPGALHGMSVRSAICDRSEGPPSSVLWVREGLDYASIQTEYCVAGEGFFTAPNMLQVFLRSEKPDTPGLDAAFILFLVGSDFIVGVSR